MKVCPSKIDYPKVLNFAHWNNTFCFTIQNIKQMEEMLMEKEKMAGNFIKGSTYGRSVNYAGCCWTWSYTCFAHDML